MVEVADAGLAGRYGDTGRRYSRVASAPLEHWSLAVQGHGPCRGDNDASPGELIPIGRHATGYSGQ